MLEMFKPEMSLAIESACGQPTTTTECIERAYGAEHHWNQIKEGRARAREDIRKHDGQTDTNAGPVHNKNNK